MADDTRDELQESIEQQRDFYRKLNQSPDISEEANHELSGSSKVSSQSKEVVEEKIGLAPINQPNREKFDSIDDAIDALHKVEMSDDEIARATGSLKSMAPPPATLEASDEIAEDTTFSRVAAMVRERSEALGVGPLSHLTSSKSPIEAATPDHNELTLEDLSQNTAAYAEAQQSLRMGLHGIHPSGVDLNVGAIPEKGFLDDDYVQQAIAEAQAEVTQSPTRGRS